MWGKRWKILAGLILLSVGGAGLLRYAYGVCISDAVSLATLLTLIVTARYIYLYFKETRKTNELFNKNMRYERLPIIKFKVNNNANSPNQEDVYVTNKGFGAAFEVSVSWSISMDVNTRNTAEPEIHQGRYKYPIISCRETLFLTRWRSLGANEAKIIVCFRDVFKNRYHWEYGGPPRDLHLIHWSAEPDS